MSRFCPNTRLDVVDSFLKIQNPTFQVTQFHGATFEVLSVRGKPERKHNTTKSQNHVIDIVGYLPLFHMIPKTGQQIKRGKNPDKKVHQIHANHQSSSLHLLALHTKVFEFPLKTFPELTSDGFVKRERVNRQIYQVMISEAGCGRTMQNSESLRNKIVDLEQEKTELIAEIEQLRKKAEKKANALEKEVAELSKEAESLKKLVEDLE